MQSLENLQFWPLKEHGDWKSIVQSGLSPVHFDLADDQGTYLPNLTNLPANVVNISSCFSECSKIEGRLTIDCNPAEYSNLFTSAAVATKVHLAGKSNLINELIDECNNDNISKIE